MEEKMKCRDCKWLDWNDKRSVGYACVNPNIVHRKLGMFKYPSTPACRRGFEIRNETGEWCVKRNRNMSLSFYVCSECGFTYCGKLKNYCPNCGANMRGVYD